MNENNEHLIDYNYYVSESLKNVIIKTLEMVSMVNEIPGKHHFYFDIDSNFPGVVLPQFLREKYPEKITLVLQHEFDDLIVTNDYFEVTLYFSQQPHRIKIPIDSILKFIDPHANFMLEFNRIQKDHAHEENNEMNKNIDNTPKEEKKKEEKNDDNVIKFNPKK